MNSQPESKEPEIDFMPLWDGLRHELKDSDRYLVSFPRSGRTWTTRVFRIARLLDASDPWPEHDEIKAMLGPPSASAYNLNRAGPGWKNPLQEDGCLNYLITHTWTGLCPSARGPHVYLIRRPDDVLVSYYHFAIRKGHIDERETSLSEFAWGNLPWWIDHAKTAIRHLENSSRTCPAWALISYEGLLKSPFSNFLRLADRFELGVSEPALRHALEFLTPAVMRETIKGFPMLDSRSGRGAKDLPWRIKAKIRKTAMPLYHSALEFEQAW